ncbi:GDSL-like Lipase/Acylhydrolase [Aquisphaera giovannonii]|uniref:GDSL-like Lipase/Acylhydrolase n=1 Tax=Aquisphaera giovannonii TaxID=406548 RepID=A0A5B9W3Q3_9BACT|nr:SGNH/GDSL hydrolase family protein [Aquisphaera giovannonii]QEH34715.1 GDSL-like Lipase/Acylhydrolase [Aquisphaera giovannonii]
MPPVLHLADRRSPAFEPARLAVDVACAGDSITGWNNFGPARDWPCRTYPEFLATLCEPQGLIVGDGGIAGEVSLNGVDQVRDYLRLFPNARYFVVGYGTNDLGLWPDVEETSPRVIENLGRMAGLIREAGRRPILLNVPPANGSMFPRAIAEQLRCHRAYHNGRLGCFCRDADIPLVDLNPVLRDEHFADELHPNDDGAKIIAGEVYRVLRDIAGIAG